MPEFDEVTSKKTDLIEELEALSADFMSQRRDLESTS